MQRACLSCGAVNDEKARFCSKCGKPLSSSKVSNSSRTQKTQRTEKSYRFCKKCNDRKSMIGTANYWIEIDSLLGVGDEEEWMCEVLECKHRIPIRKTGKKRNPLLDI
ncbi:zinc-ribbon domain-containing protein [Chloroflexota bacterium]